MQTTWNVFWHEVSGLSCHVASLRRSQLASLRPGSGRVTAAGKTIVAYWRQSTAAAIRSTAAVLIANCLIPSLQVEVQSTTPHGRSCCKA